MILFSLYYTLYLSSILSISLIRCKQLQTSLDLQIGSSALKERQLTSDVEAYKLEYEKIDSNFKYQKVCKLF